MLATLATPVTAAADADADANGGFPAETEAEGNQVPGTKLTFDFVKFVSVESQSEMIYRLVSNFAALRGPHDPAWPQTSDPLTRYNGRFVSGLPIL